MEGDAGTSRLNPTTPRERDTDPADDPTATEAPADPAPEAEVTSEDRPSRLSRGWFVAVFVVLLLLAAGVATGGYLVLHAHNDNMAAARAEDQAVAAAKDCVSATNAPNPAAMAASVVAGSNDSPG